ncbi:hypothetical protein NDR87_35185 [Nocardia sp. CDC159]|uniref:DUF6545 domain-containing protein n=1 Tax=Nocardia pulmonis TaxID=2951408 RepID=A0A9X2J0M7_9NOCA|nr:MULTISPECIES: DUF6545 domain-containing protein [Nocardia]MCM6778733.1 hypothetical protein [Nocardia pulmonis]MCM6791622.1 hypothetical protein [Nocardia sp. CDC159]
MVFVVVAAVIRLVVVRRSSETDHLINGQAVVWAVAVVLREPAVARQLAGLVPGGLPALFDLWHGLVVVAWVWRLGLLPLRRYGAARYRRPFRALMAVGVGLALALPVLSSPARAQGVSIAAYGGWRYAVYMGAYSALPVVASCCLVGVCVTMWRRATTSSERFVVTIVFVFVAVSMLPATSFALFGVLGALGAGTTLTAAAYRLASEALASGELDLLLSAVLWTAAIPSWVQEVRHLIRLRRMYPVWRDLTAAVPTVVLRLEPEDRRGMSPQAKVDDRRIEIKDAARLVASAAAPLPAAVQDLIDDTVEAADQEDMRSVAEMVLAARRLAHGTAHPARRSPGERDAFALMAPDEPTLLRLWAPAKALVDAADQLAQRGVRAESLSATGADGGSST